MTLVLQYCNNQVKNLSFEPLEPKMPCVFDGEPLDFESALMGTEWPTLKDIGADDYGPAANDDTTSAKATSDSIEKTCPKRKCPAGNSSSDGDGPPEPKRACSAADSSSVADCAKGSSTNGGQGSSSSQSQQCTTHTMQDESVGTTDDDEELYFPRRRVMQMWNSRQRWKDERKKVLKMSVGKLTEIEDPELWLLRSVLINNTIKKLHQDIRNERQAKIKHRQQKIDFYNEKYEPTSPSSHQRLQDNAFDESAVSTSSGCEELSARHRLGADETTKSLTSPTSAAVPVAAGASASTPSDAYDDTSCDEIFGISEDFLRVTIPDRRVSSPIPMNATVQESVSALPKQDCPKTNSTIAMEVDVIPSSSSSTTSSLSCSPKQRMDCDMCSSTLPSASASGNHHQHQNSLHSHQRAQQTGDVNSSVHQRHHLNGSSQCATQFRTNASDGDALSVGDNVFPPRVPILDSVVYHSLLASLESS